MPQRGLSLIQLLIGLSLIALLAHLALPSFRETIDAHRRQVSADALVTSLRTARTEAILRQRDVVIHALEEDWSRGWRIIIDRSGQGHLDPNNPVLVERRSDGMTPIKGNRWLEQFVRFTALGSINPQNGASMGGTVHICATDRAVSHHQIVLAATGRIRHEKRAVPEALCASAGLQQGANA
ncbi:GspH/FimT family protein [Pseudomonas gingeri]|uniref:Type II secretion system protein H n=1 Tax=Pseudomonas gingeri TaxID=117681 RepID=A0A7Y7XDC8_9PSED|nr:GspH/FimT family protein [Pseudomonas gingeri]NWA26722.1 GspH/FimT family protein [Pseudomonas gingeri]NWB97808.1 GspH/FimT family protein [Pseudomonas gingeri]NWD70534.1 GspH/FimT family protein [Pseudomonas gingeri]NWD75621.1 GspH/FimT family protein [Pseudomonas gingeri]